MNVKQSKNTSFKKKLNSKKFNLNNTMASPYQIPAEPIGPPKSIYEIITQEIQMPEGLLYRGKYCGKSKLRLKVDEFG